MLRMSASPLQVLANASDDVSVSVVPNLDQYVTSNVALRPTSLKLTVVATGVTVTKMSFRKTINPEQEHVLYKGPAISLDRLFEMLGPDAVRNDFLTPLVFGSEHGVELVLVCSKGAGQYDGHIVWGIKNAVGDPGWQGEFAQGEGGVLTKLAIAALLRGQLSPSVQNVREAAALSGDPSGSLINDYGL